VIALVWSCLLRCFVFVLLYLSDLVSNLAHDVCCDVAITQINYPSLNKQYSIEQAKGWSQKKVLVQIFMLYDMQVGGLKLSMLYYSKQTETINAKSKKTKIYQENKHWS
jgi:hypothetical protein